MGRRKCFAARLANLLLVAIVACLLPLATGARAAIVFDNIGSQAIGNFGLTVGTTAGVVYREALVFTAEESGRISEIEIGFLAIDPTPLTVGLSLYESWGVSPGSLVDSSSAVATGLSLLSFAGWTAPVTAGTEYWLVASAVGDGLGGWIVASSGASGETFNQRNSDWRSIESNPPTARITAAPSVVPLPAGLPLLLFGVTLLGMLGMLGAGRRESRARS